MAVSRSKARRSRKEGEEPASAALPSLGLDPAHRLSLERALELILAEGVRTSEARQVRDIVPIEQWVNSAYFIGPDVQSIYPFWKRQLVEVFKTPYAVNEVIVDGALGTGKSSFSELAMMRKLYELSCWENLPALFNMMGKSYLVFLYFSVSMTQAELTGFSELRTMIDASPYFQEEFPRKQDLSSVLVWPKSQIIFTYGSRASHAIGSNLIGSILDEANFYAGDAALQAGAAEFGRVAKLYASIVHRSQSRFMQQGRDASLSLLVSSSTHANSFTEERKRRAKQDSHCRVIETKLWEVKPPGTYSKSKFSVFIGNELLDPFLVESVADVNQFMASQGLEPLPDDLRVDRAVKRIPGEFRSLFVEVPTDFKKSFDADLITALQDIAGVSVAPMGKLFTAKPVYIQACERGRRAALSHPFTREQVTVATGTDSLPLASFLRADFQFRDRSRPRYLHVDQSTTTCATGIACCYVSGYLEDEDGLRKSVVSFDFMLRIPPPKAPRQISIPKIRDFIVMLPKRFGILLGNVTYDAFGSIETLQVMEEMGITSGHRSVAKDDVAYRAIANMLFEERLLLYRYEPFEQELFGLIHDRARSKVDHEPGSSKDVTDAVAGALANALEAPMGSMRPRSEDTQAFVEVNAPVSGLPDELEWSNLLDDDDGFSPTGSSGFVYDLI